MLQVRLSTKCILCWLLTQENHVTSDDIRVKQDVGMTCGCQRVQDCKLCCRTQVSCAIIGSSSSIYALLTA